MGQSALLIWMMPTMTPKSPMAEAKISMIKILTNVEGVCESARAQPDQMTPTETPQNKFERPTEIPAPKIA